MKASANWNWDGGAWNGGVWNSLMWLVVVAVLACVLVPFICSAMDTCRKIKDQMDRNGHTLVVAVCLDRNEPWT